MQLQSIYPQPDTKQIDVFTIEDAKLCRDDNLAAILKIVCCKQPYHYDIQYAISKVNAYGSCGVIDM